jgi:hypothetical protein
MHGSLPQMRWSVVVPSQSLTDGAVIGSLRPVCPGGAAYDSFARKHSSVAGLRGSVGSSSYCATKGGVRLFAKAVAMECAWARDNIRVNTIHPGIIDTPIWTKLPASLPTIDPHQLAKAAAPAPPKRSPTASSSSATMLPPR